MPQRLPIDFVAEFRGIKPASEFVDRTTGEKRVSPARVKLERQDDNGDVDLIEVTGSQLDKVVPAFNYAELKKGEMVRVQGVVTIQDRGSDRDSYVQYTAAEVVKASSLKAA